MSTNTARTASLCFFFLGGPESLQSDVEVTYTADTSSVDCDDNSVKSAAASSRTALCNLECTVTERKGSSLN